MDRKSFIKTAVMAGIPFGFLMSLPPLFIDGVWQKAIFMGVFSGVVYGLALSQFVQIQKTKRRRIIEHYPPRLAADEKILFDAAAEYTLDNTRIKGWLFLTSRNLIFTEINETAVKQTLYFPLKDIFKVKLAMHSVIFPTGLRVFSENQLEKFVVDNRKKWSRQIEQAAGLKLKK